LLGLVFELSGAGIPRGARHDTLQEPKTTATAKTTAMARIIQGTSTLELL
jgi:hypothetical protein